MRLRRVLWISALIGFGIPIASYWVWQSAYAVGIGKILDDWNARVGLFTSLEDEIAARVFHGITLPSLFDYVFWDVLWVAAINALIYMVLASAWWGLGRRKSELRLGYVLAVTTVIGFGVPLASYFVWLLIPSLTILSPFYQLLGPQPFMLRDVVTVAVVNLPIFAFLGLICWMLGQLRGEPKPI